MISLKYTSDKINNYSLLLIHIWNVSSVSVK